MKKILAMCVLTVIANLSYAQTCPSANEIFVKKGDGTVEVVVPQGWMKVRDNRSSKYSSLNFSVAAWGDHKYDIDSVRCHYFKDSDHVQLNSEHMFDESKITSHPEWSYTDGHYHLCTNAGNVNACPFG